MPRGRRGPMSSATDMPKAAATDSAIDGAAGWPARLMVGFIGLSVCRYRQVLPDSFAG